MNLDDALLSKVCLWISRIAFGLAAFAFGVLLFLIYLGESSPISGFMAFVVYGSLNLILVSAGFAFGLVARDTALGRIGAFIAGILAVGGLLYSTPIYSYVMGPMGMGAVTLAFLVVADRQAQQRKPKQPPSLFSVENAGELAVPGPLGFQGWRAFLMAMAVLVGIASGLALVLGLVQVNVPNFQMGRPLSMLIRLGISVATLVLAIRLSGLFRSTQRRLEWKSGWTAKPKADVDLEPYTGLGVSFDLDSSKVTKNFDKARLGKVSLGSALAGLVVPVAGTALILVLSNAEPGRARMGPSEGYMYALMACLGLSAILHLVAFGAGLAARRTWTGTAGAVISGCILAIAGLLLLAMLRLR